MATIKDVNKCYAILLIIKSMIGNWDRAMENTLARIMAEIGRAYCEENNLPFPLPKDMVPRILLGPLSKVGLGPKATTALQNLIRFKESCEKLSGFTFTFHGINTIHL